jgi:hypothetical protein
VPVRLPNANARLVAIPPRCGGSCGNTTPRTMNHALVAATARIFNAEVLIYHNDTG